MFLFFHDLGIPSWIFFLCLFGLFACPVFSGLGIYYLVKKNVKQSTFVLAFITFLLLAFSYHFFNVSLYLSIDFFPYITAPFGSVITIILMMIGLSYIAYLIGISTNLLAIFGLVRLIERIIAKKRLS